MADSAIDANPIEASPIEPAAMEPVAREPVAIEIAGTRAAETEAAETEAAEIEAAEIEAAKWADELAQLVAECTLLLGWELTAYVGGAGSPVEVDGWIAEADETARIARDRLETACRVGQLLSGKVGETRMLAWFREPDPGLADLSPATALHLSAMPRVHALVEIRAEAYVSSSREPVSNGAVPPR